MEYNKNTSYGWLDGDSLKQILAVLRASHWSKSAFVLLGFLYSGRWEFFWPALFAAISFSLISSAVYIYNDLQDQQEDRLHPKKCYRPLAAGEVSLPFVLGLLAGCLAIGLLIGFIVSIKLAALLALYLLINIAYNHFLKNIPILDVLTIASGFMLRILAGTIGIGLPTSWWLTLSATLISLFIALCKRRLEKELELKEVTRPVLQFYSIPILNDLIVIAATSTFVTYVFYTIFAQEESFYFLLTLPFAAIGLWRFAWLATRCGDNNDDPVTLFFMDNLSYFNLACFLGLTFIALFQ